MSTVRKFKVFTLVMICILCMGVLSGCGETEPVEAKVGEEIALDSLTLTIDKISCEKDVMKDNWSIMDDKADGVTGYLVAKGRIANKSGSTIPKGAIKATFTYGEETVDADVRAISMGNTYNRNGEDMADGETYEFLCITPVSCPYEEVGAAELMIGFNDKFDSAEGKDMLKLKNVYKMTESDTYPVIDIKKGEKASKDGEYEFTIKEIGDDDELKWQETPNYSHSYSIDDYCIYIKTSYKNLDKSELESWNNNYMQNESVEMKCGDFSFTGGFWIPNDIPALGTAPVFVYFNVPKNVVKDKNLDKVATFKIGDDLYRVTVE